MDRHISEVTISNRYPTKPMMCIFYHLVLRYRGLCCLRQVVGIMFPLNKLSLFHVILFVTNDLENTNLLYYEPRAL